jgi:nucleoside-diphosphate-sugar epimerase
VVAVDLDLTAIRDLTADVPVQMLEGDIADPIVQEQAVRGVGTVFHLAAAHLSVSAGASVYRRVNVDAVRDLAILCLEQGVRRLVHCSTVGVFGALQDLPADEDTVCNPEFEYEKTKLEGEKILLGLFRDRGLPVTILRPAWVYGPGCPRTEKLFRAIRRGRFVIAGKGSSSRHSVYIRDMITAFEQAAVVDSAVGKTIIIADDEAVTVRELVQRISHIVGASTPRSVPFGLLHGVGAFAEVLFGLLGKEPPISTRTLRFFSGNTAFRTDRAKRLLGFSPRYGINDGLRETFEIMEGEEFWTVPMPPSAQSPDR